MSAQRVKERFDANFRMPLLRGALDTPSRLYSSLGIRETCSLSIVFAAEVSLRIRSEDTTHSLKHYLPLVAKSMKEEARYFDWHKEGVQFSATIRAVSESLRTMRNFVYDRPFSKIRYTEIRLLGPLHPLCGIQHDYPKPKFRTESSRKDFMQSLENKKVPVNGL
ncbi:hypothetical protein BDW02DRAFT_602946 [Decorospora gaudefroyi]|uniref:Uncharacterized protein n=1 Tax=Decorospora gaudefroyi TaxID=184978 RepID=A0A6A5JXZ4_9PLEO|nr:hypothetical protein BDW02DRAFT_602946 [Decorospora gaudefroyi]